jgi:hypothetical protein
MVASSVQNAATAARQARALLEISGLILFLPVVQLLFDFLAGSMEDPMAPVYSDFPLVPISKTSLTTTNPPQRPQFSGLRGDIQNISKLDFRLVFGP